ncbi:MAG: DUF1566 domain-containing protein [Myxococcales bacterium]|nr:DUF1566 domain-containing protein [Myxococcales bacterium]
MAVVYRATHTAMGTEHAIKVLLPNLAMNPKTVERFRQEARAQFRLRHPNIVQVTDYVETDEEIALVMDLVHGMTLRAAMDQRPGPWSAANVVEVMRPVIDAVSFAHRQGLDGAAVVHRDLKPENILLDLGQGQPWPGTPKVADFGIAKVKQMDTDRQLTGTNARMGTVPYMAPEQYSSAKDVDPRADVWALGMMLWHLLAGRLPVNPNNNLELYELYAGRVPVPHLLAVVPGIPQTLSDAVAQALSVDVAGRFQDAWPLLRAVESAVQPRLVVEVAKAVDAPAGPSRPAVGLSARAAAAQKPAQLPEVAVEQAVAVVGADEAIPPVPSWTDLYTYAGLLGVLLLVGVVVAFAGNGREQSAPTLPVAENSVKPLVIPGYYAAKTRDEVDAMPKFDGDAGRFKASNVGTVQDSKLGLVWQQGDSANALDWAGAKDYCAGLALAGTGWRLPTVGELHSLIDERRGYGERIARPFNNSDNWFWTATAYPGSFSNAWLVNFYFGNSNGNGTTGTCRVRCVR